jgi:hypothetical protein
MEKRIKETTRLLLQGKITKKDADKILLDLHNIEKLACIHPLDKVWNYNGKRFCGKCNSWLE